MQAVILAGGYGTRLGEETRVRPKPMVEIGGKPILWHIMKLYSYYGIRDFIICCGHRGHVIKEYFFNFSSDPSNILYQKGQPNREIHFIEQKGWTVTLVDTGDKTGTGGRMKKVGPIIKDDEFCFTYGDGVSDINIDQLVSFHQSKGRLATVTAVLPPPRFGALQLSGDKVVQFKEKNGERLERVNGGFFVLSKKVLAYINGDATAWEEAPMEKLAREGNLSAFRHNGFWRPMDTRSDQKKLEELWQTGEAPWKVW